MEPDRPQTAFILSLVAGVLILIGSIAMAFMINAGYWWMGMSGGHYMMMGTFSLTSGFMYVLVAFGALCGVIVLIASIMLNSRPHQASTWGIIILIFSFLSLIGMGGFILGAVLGIVGGLLALTWPGSGQGIGQRT